MGTNEAGLIVGWADEETAEPELLKCRSRAFFWEDYASYNLGALVSGDPVVESVAETIRNTAQNEPLQVVGTNTTDKVALLWEKDAEIWSLAILIDELKDEMESSDCLNEWSGLRAAKDISDAGWITGWGRHSGDWRAYLLTPISDCPEDVNGDEVVDVDDLFGVLAHWGDPIPGTIWVWDVTFDCTVDTDDTFAVLAAWGPCEGDGGGGGQGLAAILADWLADWLADGGAAAPDKGLVAWDDINDCLTNESEDSIETCLYGLLKE